VREYARDCDWDKVRPYVRGLAPRFFPRGAKCWRRAVLPVLPPLENSLTNVPFPWDSVIFSGILPLAKGNVSCSDIKS